MSADGQALVQHVLGDRHGRDRHLGPGWRRALVADAHVRVGRKTEESGAGNLGAFGGDAQDALQRLGDFLGVRVLHADRFLAQGTLRLLLPLGGLRGELALDRFGLFDLGLGQLRPHFRLALQLRLFYAGPRLALLGQLLGGDDAHHAAALDLLETPRAQNGIERELPGHVAERDRHLALHVVADDDVAAALGGKDAEQVDDVGVLEVERDEMRAARGRRRRNDRRGRRSRGLRLSWRLGHHPRGRPRDRRGLHRRREHRHRLDLRRRSRRRVLGLGRRFGHYGTLQGKRLGSRGDVGDYPRDHDRQTVLVLTDRVPDLAGELDDEAGDPLPVLRAADLFHRRLGDGQGRLAPRIHGVFEIDDEPARRIHELGVILGGAGRRDVHDRRVGLMFDGDLFELSRRGQLRLLGRGPRRKRDQERE